MKTKVSDCLTLEAFQGAELISGRHRLGGRIRSVSVMDSADPEDAVRENGIKEQLVLTSFRGMTAEGMASSVKGLAEKGVSGILVFNRNGKADSIPGKVVEAALSVGLPFLAMPKHAGYADVIEQVMGRLLYGDSSFENDLINNTIYHLLNFEKHSNFEAALKEAAIKNSFQVILFSRDFNPVLTIETRKRTTIADAVRMGKSKDIDKGGALTFVDVNGVLTYWGPVIMDGEKYFLMIVDNDDNYSSAEISKLAEIIELAMGMWKYTPERDVKAEFIKALMRSNRSLAYSLADEAGMSADRILGVFFLKSMPQKAADSVIAGYEKEAGLSVIRLSEGDETNGVISAAQKADREQAGRAAAALMNELGGPDSGARVFHVAVTNGIEGAGDGFRLIGETWNFAESIYPRKRVLSKFELALVSNCVNIQVSGGYQKKNYTALLEPFARAAGANKPAQLLATLETFVLDAEMNSVRTGAMLGVHVNTVQYRLKKINDILGVEVTGHRVMPGLTIALALRRLERVAERQGGIDVTGI